MDILSIFMVLGRNPNLPTGGNAQCALLRASLP